MLERRANYVWIAVLATSAILVGALSVAPQLLIKKSVEFTGRTFVLNQFLHLHDGGDGYFQFAREVADGHFPPSDLFFDYSRPNIYPPLPPLILGIFVVLFGGITNGYLAALFFIPALLFLLFYWIGTIIFEKNRLYSIFFALIGIFTPFSFATTEAFSSLTNFANIVLKNFYPGVKTLLPLPFYARADYPLLTAPLYLTAIGSFLVFWRKPKLLYAVFAGAAAGLLFYTYFHKWAYWIVVLGLAFLYSLVFLRKPPHHNEDNKNLALKTPIFVWCGGKNDWLRIKSFCLLIGTTAAVSIPYFINYFSLKALPGSADFIGRISLEVGRNFRWQSWREYLVYAVIAALVYWVMWRKPEQRSRAAFYFCVLAAAFVIWNIQIVLGYVPHSDHWPRAINPVLFLITFDLLYCLFRDWKYAKKTKTIFMIILILMSLLVIKKIFNASMFISPNQETLKRYVLPEDVLTAYRWMDQNLNEPKVVSPSLLTSIYISAFTSARPFLPWGPATSISNFDLEEHFLKANKLFGIAPEILEARLRDGKGLVCKENCDQPYAESNLADARTYLYQNYFINPENPRQRSIPEAKIKELLNRYQKISVDFDGVDADYVFYGPWERDFGQIELYRLKNLELVYRNETAEVYKIKK